MLEIGKYNMMLNVGKVIDNVNNDENKEVDVVQNEVAGGSLVNVAGNVQDGTDLNQVLNVNVNEQQPASDEVCSIGANIAEPTANKITESAREVFADFIANDDAGQNNAIGEKNTNDDNEISFATESPATPVNDASNADAFGNAEHLVSFVRNVPTEGSQEGLETVSLRFCALYQPIYKIYVYNQGDAQNPTYYC